MSEENKKNVEFPPEKAYHLIKIDVVEEIKKELVQWAKKKVQVLSLVIMILSSLGLTTLLSYFVIQRFGEKLNRSSKCKQ